MYKTSSVVVISVAPAVFEGVFLLKSKIRVLYFGIILGTVCTDHCDYSTSVQNHVYEALSNSRLG